MQTYPLLLIGLQAPMTQSHIYNIERLFLSIRTVRGIHAKKGRSKNTNSEPQTKSHCIGHIRESEYGANAAIG